MTRLTTYLSRTVLACFLLAGIVPSTLLAQDASPTPAVAEAGAQAPAQADAPVPDGGDAGGFMDTADRYVGYVNGWISAVFFADVLFWYEGAQLPLVVVWLVFGATFLTFRMGFINLRAFRHAVDVTRGKYSNPADQGEVSHFQALAAALSATVGLGNIAGVAIAVSVGGPGATFWMIVAGLLGMSSKF